MPEMQDHDFGTFNWAEIATTDIEGAKAFYGDLMGWEFAPQVVNGELMYTMCTLNGLNVCGLAGTMAEGQPASWNLYTCVENVDAMSAKVTSLGGQVMAGPMDVFEYGRMSFVVDPQGALLGLWQPRLHRGVQVMMEPGTFMWAELMTWDSKGSSTFYQQLFGWETVVDHSNPDYTLFVPGGDNSRNVYLAGQLTMNENFDGKVSTNWGVYLSVENTEETLRRCVELGGEQLVGAMEIAQGTFAVMKDPQGAVFNIMQPSH